MKKSKENPMKEEKLNHAPFTSFSEFFNQLPLSDLFQSSFSSIDETSQRFSAEEPLFGYEVALDDDDVFSTPKLSPLTTSFDDIPELKDEEFQSNADEVQTDKNTLFEKMVQAFLVSPDQNNENASPKKQAHQQMSSDLQTKKHHPENCKEKAPQLLRRSARINARLNTPLYHLTRSKTNTQEQMKKTTDTAKSSKKKRSQGHS